MAKQGLAFNCKTSVHLGSAPKHDDSESHSYGRNSLKSGCSVPDPDLFAYAKYQMLPETAIMEISNIFFRLGE